MKNILKSQQLFLWITLLMMTTLSCQKLIEIDFPNNQLPIDLVFEDEQTADAALAGLYGNLWDASLISGGSDGMGTTLGIYTDDLSTVFASTNNGIEDIHRNVLLPTNSSVSSIWTNAYKQVFMANSIIEGVERSKSISTVSKNRIKGETIFVRSLLFFYLYQIFGEIPYTTTTDYMTNKSLVRMPKDQFLSKIEVDMAEAVALLPDNYRNVERIYPNRATAELLLAKLKMLMGKWGEVEGLTTSILSRSTYVFQTDLSKVFQKTGTHIIWQLKPRNANDPTKEAVLYNFTTIPTSFMLNTNLVGSFASNDLRRQHYFTPVTSDIQLNYKQTKYKITTVTNTIEYSVVFRLEDVHLMLAEALIAQGKISQAVPHVNRTRQRAGLAALETSISEDIATHEMRNERRREFFAEHGNRFFDLKRWGVLGQLSLVKNNWQTYHQYWPLPLNEMLLNTNLKPQNNGY